MRDLDWRKIPSLTSLRAFEAAARLEGVSAAARSLNVTHAAVTQQIKALEAHLGVQLLNRTSKGVTPTADGHVLAKALQEGFLTIAAGVADITEREANRAVRVTTTTYFAEVVILPRLAEFWRAHPDIEIAFSPSDIAVDILAEGFDLAVRASAKPEASWDGVVAERLCSCRDVVCAAPHLVDDPDTDWSSLPWLIESDSTWQYPILEAAGVDTSNITTIDIGDPTLELRAAEEGIGLSVAAEIVVRPRLASGRLKLAPFPLKTHHYYHAVKPPGPTRPAVRKFITWLTEVLESTEATVSPESAATSGDAYSAAAPSR